MQIHRHFDCLFEQYCAQHLVMATLSLRQSSKKPMPPPLEDPESPDHGSSGARTHENIMMSFSLVVPKECIGREQCRR